MKKSVLIFAVALLVLISTGLWFYQPGVRLQKTDVLPFAILILLVAFALFIGFKRLASERRGEPPEDELSRMILQKAAAWSYYFSLYMWLVMIYISDKGKMATDELIGAGVIAMGVAFGVFWVFFYLRGIKNE